MAGASRGKRHHGVASSERLHSTIARDIGTAIVTGRHRPGEVLTGELAYSEALKISRSAYREAIRILAAKGLVESRPKAGTRVCERRQWNLLDPDVLGWMLENEPSPALIAELFEVRELVEPAAAALAARRRSDAQLARMAAALAEMESCDPDSPEGQAADARFHQAILEATGNEMLVRLGTIITLSVDYVASFKRERSVPRDSRPDHAALYQAIAAQRPAGAREIMFGLLEHARADMEAC